MSSQYWLIGCSASRDERDSVFLNLKSRIYDKQQLCDDVRRFDVPDNMKFGSFDNLIRLLDELSKHDTNAEAVVRRMERQVLELDPQAEFKIISQRSQMSHEQYVSRFAWDDAKFPRTRALSDNLALLLQSLQKLDDTVKNKASQFNDLKTSVQSWAKRDQIPLAQRDLVDVLTPEVCRTGDFVETAHMVTCVAVISKDGEKDWLTSYENWEKNVVPQSAFKFKGTEDKDGNCLWRVVMFKNAVEGFKAAARSRKIVVREFAFSEAKYHEQQRARATLEAECKKSEAKLRDVAHAAFSDSFVAWTHLKATRMFIEAVLRFGVPTNFASFIVKVKKESSKQQALRTELSKVFTADGLFGHSYIGQTGGEKEQSGEGPDGGEYFPYVSLPFMPLGGKQ